jgi:hypothetical protein
VAKGLAAETTDGFFLWLFGDDSFVEDGRTFVEDFVGRFRVFVVHAEGGYLLIGFAVFGWFDPFGFEDGKGFESVEVFVGAYLEWIFSVELDRGKLGYNLVGAIFEVST